MTVLAVAALAVALDRLLPEPARHPLGAFARLAAAAERRANSGPRRRLRGGMAAAALIAPPALAAAALASVPGAGLAVSVATLWLALGGRSLGEHATRVQVALDSGNLEAARTATGCLVSRDTAAMSSEECAAATVESVLENGSDAVFAALFWFLIAGAGGVVAYRLANTLDALWGYRTPRFEAFGLVAARLDDALNYIPARLTAATYALLGKGRDAWRAWRRDGDRWSSPNAGLVMAAGAGALGLRLGGGARYHGEWRHRPALGDGRPTEGTDIARATALVERGIAVWLTVIAGGYALA
ncbi:adenosylcobinamide-phosphate synthase CbiB [Arhodomonas sp. AD133]|uniref:adenosylcobinamide-phosphate synthase CbiB n=1 Tax=Arhodomonas sp. AD133 TaxID=3415009 RepID=UPI003EBD2C7C